MKKVSDDARSKLNELGFSYFVFFVLMFFLCATIATRSTSNPNGTELFSLTIVIFISYTWIFKRSKIIRDNKDDIKREHAIDDCLEDCFLDINITEEIWLNKDLTSPRFFNTKEANKFQKNIILYKFFLDRQNTLGVYQAVEAIIFLDNLDDDIVMMDEIDRVAFILSTGKIKLLLERFFHFIRWQYHNRRGLSMRDYTFKAIKDLSVHISAETERVILKKQKDVFKIFQSGEKFQIAGEIVKVGNGKEIFLITAVKTEKQHIVLFPIKMTKSMFAILNNIIAQ